jgi:plasmid maintenance system antidote protein VapI
MEIKKVANGWEYDGIVFTTKKDAKSCKDETEKDAPSMLPKGASPKDKPIFEYDSKDPTSFGEFVAAYSMKNEISFTDLAKNIGVTKQALYDWINGTSMPSAKNSKNIIDATQCSNAELISALKTNLYIKLAKSLGMDWQEALEIDQTQDQRKRVRRQQPDRRKQPA